MTKLSEVKEGDTLIADAGFICLKPGEHVVHEEYLGNCYLCCSHGRHYLGAQIDSNGNLVGLKLK